MTLTAIICFCFCFPTGTLVTIKLTVGLLMQLYIKFKIHEKDTEKKPENASAEMLYLKQ